MHALKGILPLIQIVVAVFLATAILLQQRGTGLSASFGGEGNVYRTKRGLEKVIFSATIVLVIIFIALAILSIVLH